MRGIGIAQIIILILFVVIPLINYFLARKERQRQERIDSRRPRAPAPVPTGTRRAAAPESVPPPAPSNPRPRASAPPPVPTPIFRPGERWSRQTLFRSKRDLRRTIVAMTILGPCRANDLPD
ncbi:MAG TPA: hypothetical protein VMR20_09585 [Verrucomicrobiae bacterium]|jgi:hypothetical protein|nr:hypothetical protein [Verrucomicrobiae bacterium]